MGCLTSAEHQSEDRVARLLLSQWCEAGDTALGARVPLLHGPAKRAPVVAAVLVQHVARVARQLKGPAPRPNVVSVLASVYPPHGRSMPRHSASHSDL